MPQLLLKLIKQQEIFINETITLQFYFQNFESVQRNIQIKKYMKK